MLPPSGLIGKVVEKASHRVLVSEWREVWWIPSEQSVKDFERRRFSECA